ncbi:N-acetylgalactosamine 6-phosphate deacetylase [Carnobacterium iners]|uniref:N-acetylglucosamine-6-phosphate deacetylase n=1 Tax=Carnobacterium iners TaxID=1073423 RepID=A0A1X7NDB6_9LACT|nr:N-acetylglucosamine-6-phosphate deacetylase [Carnobacterium iners]SEK53479.1 N-acetylgalactosamine 6-phosphate deacetylase [Carnobacterium iners]SMH34910.1 N-acetylgalactosamine 6-phosphate deacetylase [Carnobacterium iners]
MSKYIFAEQFFLENNVTGPGYLEIIEGKFGDFYQEKPSTGNEILDYTGYSVAPGLVDTHIHGFKNHDLMATDAAGLNVISEGLLSCGVTSFLATTLTSLTEKLDQAVKMVGDNYKQVTGAKIKGIFLEGPFFTEKYKGAQNPKYFGDPTIEKLKKWQELSSGTIKKIALAPERTGVSEFIEYAAKDHINVALGHSDATYEEAKLAVEKGASIFVHTYNGMRPLNHREPGMVGAAMDLKGVFAELICDGHHVHPVAANILMNARGRKETVLITDCMMAGGMPEGHYELGEFPVEVKDGAARLESGSLAGSVLELKDAVKNVVEWGIATPEEAIQMATIVPAKSVEIADDCGKIAPGYAADFIVLDSSLTLKATFLDGKCRYQTK